MEKTMKIQKVLPIQDRQYQDQQGQQRVLVWTPCLQKQPATMPVRLWVT